MAPETVLKKIVEVTYAMSGTFQNTIVQGMLWNKTEIKEYLWPNSWNN